MMGSYSMSEKLCYFCTEHEMRALPTGKEKKKKNLRGFQVMGHDLGKLLGNLGGVARWPQTQHLHESRKSAAAPSLLLVNIFHQVGS